MRAILFAALTLFLAPTLFLGVAEASGITPSEDSLGRVFLRQEEGRKREIVPVFIDQSGSLHELKGQLPEEVGSGDRVTIKPPHARSAEIIDSRPNEPAQGRDGVMLVAVSWPGEKIEPIDPRDFRALPRWSLEASGGVWSWDPVTVLHVTISRQPLCDENSRIDDRALLGDVRQEIAKRGYNLLRDYGALGIALPSSVRCLETAYAYLGCRLHPDNLLCGSSFYSRGYLRLETLIHELGHTLGLLHAQALRCPDTSLSYSHSCQHVEYGDFYDPMGSSWSASMYNPSHVSQLGWLEGGSSYVEGNNQPQTAHLRPYALGKGRRYMAVNLPPWSPGGLSPGKIYIEYRHRVGIDQSLWTSSACSFLMPEHNIFLRFVPSREAAEILGLREDSYLLDTSSGNLSSCALGLEPGGSWTDPSGEVAISFLGVYRGRARILIDSEPAPPYKPGRIRIQGPRDRIVRGSSLGFIIHSSRNFSHIGKSDFYLQRGKCERIGVRKIDEKRAFLRLARCLPGRVRFVLRSRSLRDGALRQMPEGDVFSGIFNIKP